jgi:hypothetical protein
MSANCGGRAIMSSESSSLQTEKELTRRWKRLGRNEYDARSRTNFTESDE